MQFTLPIYFIVGLISIIVGACGLPQAIIGFKSNEIKLKHLSHSLLILAGLLLILTETIIVPDKMTPKTIIAPEDLRDNSYYSVMGQISDETCSVVLLKDSPDSDPRTVKIYKSLAPEIKFASKKDLLDLMPETPTSSLN